MVLDFKAQTWCFNNGYKIYIKPIKNRKDVQIEIQIRNRVINSQKFYPNQTVASDKIWELYSYFYEKHKKKLK